MSENFDEMFHGLPRPDYQRYGRSPRKEPRRLTPDERERLAAALAADEPPHGIAPPSSRGFTRGPAHLAGDRVRTEPLPMPDADGLWVRRGPAPMPDDEL